MISGITDLVICIHCSDIPLSCISFRGHLLDKYVFEWTCLGFENGCSGWTTSTLWFLATIFWYFNLRRWSCKKNQSNRNAIYQNNPHLLWLVSNARLPCSDPRKYCQALNNWSSTQHCAPLRRSQVSCRPRLRYWSNSVRLCYSHCTALRGSYQIIGWYRRTRHLPWGLIGPDTCHLQVGGRH